MHAVQYIPGGVHSVTLSLEKWVTLPSLYSSRTMFEVHADVLPDWWRQLHISKVVEDGVTAGSSLSSVLKK